MKSSVLEKSSVSSHHIYIICVYVRVSSKTKILSTLNDKRYIFHDGILILPAGHKALRPLLAFNESVGEECNLLTDKHIRALIKMEIDVIRKHPYLALLSKIYGQNRKKFTSQQVSSSDSHKH